MTTGTSLLEKPSQRIPPEERVGSVLATSRTPSELKLEHFQERQVAEGIGSLQLSVAGTDTSLQGQVASNVDVVPQQIRSPVVHAIRPYKTLEVSPYLNGDMEKLARVLLTLIEVESGRSWMPVEKLEIGLKRSYEEDWIEVVFRVYVKANAAQAMAFWHAIGSAIDRWRPSLAPLPQRLLDEQVAVFVEWT